MVDTPLKKIVKLNGRFYGKSYVAISGGFPYNNVRIDSNEINLHFYRFIFSFGRCKKPMLMDFDFCHFTNFHEFFERCVNHAVMTLCYAITAWLVKNACR